MSIRHLAQALASSGVLFTASWSHAQCTKDTDCKGQRVCDKGQCVVGPAAAPAAATPVPAPAPAPAATPVAVPVEAPAEPPKPRMQRHSTGMMAGGIVMVSFTPIALLVAAVANAQQTVCEVGDYSYGIDENGDYGRISTAGAGCDDYDATIYGGLISAVVLAGVGIPLIVIGAKKEPVNQVEARITPWASPQGAGVGLRIDM